MRIFIFLVALVACTPALEGQSEQLAFHWQVDHDSFGGISGIEVTVDGNSLVAISDRGMIVTADIVRSGGRISDVVNTQMRYTPRYDDSDGIYDTEGLAIGKNGKLYISVERVHKVVVVDGNQATELPQPEAFTEFVDNGSLEALAIDDDGALFTIPERSGLATKPFPVYRYFSGEWDLAFSIPRRGSFLVVGADFGPDGRLYVLERHFTGFGFKNRVRRFDRDGQSEKTVWESRHGLHDNLEGISVWQSDAGPIMTMVSDNNFIFLQRTEIVEYPIPD